MNIIDLFSGAGGLSLGATRAGFNVLGAFENDKFALDTHKRNFPNSQTVQADISQIDAPNLLDSLNVDECIHGIVGGPPCQGFSVIGHGNIDDTRNSLFVKFFELVSNINPWFYLAENVPGILNEKYNSIRDDAFAHVRDQYIQLAPMTVKAYEYGAPTTRTRVFFIGYRRDLDHINLSHADFDNAKIKASVQITVKDALIGLPRIIRYAKNHSGERKIEGNYINNPEYMNHYFHSRVFGRIPHGVGDPETINKYLKKGIVTGCLPTKHTETVKKRYKKVKCGQCDKVSKSIKLHPDGICPTIRAGTGVEKGSFQAVRPLHYSSPRVITPREAARLQGFPDWFAFQPTIWHSFRQIGNSVSPIVAEAILQVLHQKFT